jgi:hypothetical protein
MRRVRLHDPAGYLLALAGISLLVGFGLMSYEGTRLGEHADPWHHFTFDVAVFGFCGLAALLVTASVILFVRDMRRAPGGEHEQTGHMRAPTAAPTLAEEVEVKRWFRVELKRRFR